MKKPKIIIPILLLCIVIGAASAYFTYASKFIDITSEKSISENLAVDPEQPITIFATQKSGDYFAVIYADPTDTDKSLYHFNYLIKVPFYKNRYKSGGYSAFNTGTLCLNEANIREEKRTMSQVFIYRVGKSDESESKCSVFKSNFDGNYINFEEIKNEQQIIDKIQRQADSYKKLDEFELPDKDVFIISKTYQIESPSDTVFVDDGIISNDERKQILMDSADNIIKEYNEYKEAKP